MSTIDAETLRSWLETGKPVALLDVRSTADRAMWAIPGSLHIDAYTALKAHDSHALDGVALPADVPVVTVCNSGYTSKIASKQLEARGIEARSLEGGMQAWSLAWNTADVPLPSSTEVIQIRRVGKGCLSYLIGSEGEAVVIDAALPPEVYLELAKSRGWSITAVLDTHIHADHLSRSRLLAEQSGATVYLPNQQRVRYRFTPLRNGSTIKVGEASLMAIPTPGHTVESMSYLLDRQALFTGDTLFLQGVGRPDLHATAEETRFHAQLLHHSLHHHLLMLPARTLVLPGHTNTPTPFDKIPLTAALGKLRNEVELLRLSESEFVDALVARIPPVPPNHERIVELNEAGELIENPTELEAGGNNCAVS